MRDCMRERPAVTLEAGQLVIGRRRFALAEIGGARTERRDPKIARRLLGALLAALAIPVVLYFDAHNAEDYSGLIALPMAIAIVLFGSVMAAGSRYVLLLRHGQREEVAFASARANEVAQVESAVRSLLGDRTS
jgi:hypothetical protein